MRFWDADTGHIRLFDQSLCDLDLDDLRAHVADGQPRDLPIQRHPCPEHFDGSTDATEAEVTAAIEQASLTDFVHNLPEGLETNVGERGVAYLAANVSE